MVAIATKFSKHYIFKMADTRGPIVHGGFSHIFAVLCGFSMFFHLEISEDEDEELISLNFKSFAL